MWYINIPHTNTSLITPRSETTLQERINFLFFKNIGKKKKRKLKILLQRAISPRGYLRGAPWHVCACDVT